MCGLCRDGVWSSEPQDIISIRIHRVSEDVESSRLPRAAIPAGLFEAYNVNSPQCPRGRVHDALGRVPRDCA